MFFVSEQINYQHNSLLIAGEVKRSIEWETNLKDKRKTSRETSQLHILVLQLGTQPMVN